MSPSDQFNNSYFQARGRLFPLLKGLFYSVILKLSFRPRRLLDIGCARGEFLYFTNLWKIDSFGVDISQIALDNVPSRLKTHCRQGTITEIPFPNDYFDLVTSFATLEHVPESETKQAINELLRVSSRNAFLQICVKDNPLEKGGHYLRDSTHVNVQTSSWWKNKFIEWNLNWKEILPGAGIFLLTV